MAGWGHVNDQNNFETFLVAVFGGLIATTVNNKTSYGLVFVVVIVL